MATIKPPTKNLKRQTDLKKFFPKAKKGVVDKLIKKGVKVYLVKDMREQCGCVGLYDTAKKIIYVEDSSYGKKARYHELYHCIDFLAGSKPVSDGEFWREAYSEEMKKFKSKKGMGTSTSNSVINRYEFFAELGKYVCFYPAYIRKICPKCYKELFHTTIDFGLK